MTSDQLSSAESALGAPPTRTKVFVSYSRSEANLVEDLGERLRSRKIDPWIDFESMAVGDDWEQQLEAAVADADVVLLIVSRRAAASINVRTEWADARDSGKPVVVGVAEAVEIEEPYASYPWVDLRRGRSSDIDRLCDLLDRARVAAELGEMLTTAETTVPARGFRAPWSAWGALLASVAVAACSLFTIWSIIVPIVLVPLPLRIVRRSFNYTDVRNALIALPFAVDITDTAVGRSDDFTWWGGIVNGVSIGAALAAYLCIRTKSFRRWATPSAVRQRRPRRRDVHEAEGARVRFRIDAVPEDRRYAELLASHLEAAGHERHDDDRSAVALRFVSKFHDTAEVADRDRVLPILVSDPDDPLPRRLARRQWIDLRDGVPNWKLDAIARHLDRPDQILDEIGTPPRHGRQTLPRGVQGMFVSLWVAIATLVGYGFLLVVGLRSEIDVIGVEALVWTALLGTVAVALMLWQTRTLRLRRPTRLRTWVFPAIGLGYFFAVAPIMGSYEDDELTEAAVNGVDNANFVVLIPVICLLYFGVRHWRAVSRWVPSRSDDSSHDGTGRGGTTGRRGRGDAHPVASTTGS